MTTFADLPDLFEFRVWRADHGTTAGTWTGVAVLHLPRGGDQHELQTESWGCCAQPDPPAVLADLAAQYRAWREQQRSEETT